MTVQLFAYGTLMPADPERAHGDGWSPDAIRGRLFDLGAYPAVVDLDDPAAGWVEGYVRAVEMCDLEGLLDAWEGVAQGLYSRVETTTRSGKRAWVYVYSRPLPKDADGPLPRWRGSRRFRPEPS
jgi:gamma-glutamylcyclotransferase (GGCT)/AIG2-like uncharacterized protein YtfP